MLLILTTALCVSCSCLRQVSRWFTSLDSGPAYTELASPQREVALKYIMFMVADANSLSLVVPLCTESECVADCKED